MVFADVLQEVSDRTRWRSHRSVLELYERCTETRSRRAAALLTLRGIVPVEPRGSSRN